MKKLAKTFLIFAIIPTLLCFTCILTACGSQDNDRDPIRIIAAMYCEICDINAKVENPQKTTVGGYEYTKGTINGYPVVTCMCVGREADAAVATTILCDDYKPAYVINTSTSGGHT